MESEYELTTGTVYVVVEVGVDYNDEIYLPDSECTGVVAYETLAAAEEFVREQKRLILGSYRIGSFSYDPLHEEPAYHFLQNLNLDPEACTYEEAFNIAEKRNVAVEHLFPRTISFMEVFQVELKRPFVPEEDMKDAATRTTRIYQELR